MAVALRKLKVAVVHDFLTQIGGAEKILQTMVEIFPQATVYTLVGDKKVEREVLGKRRVVHSFLQKMPLTPRGFKLYLAIMPKATESFDFSGYDLVFSITSSFVKGVITKKPTIHINYLNTPTRYLWDKISGFYLKTSVPWYARGLVKLIFPYLKRWDLEAAERPDYIVANSKTIKKRTKKFYQRTVDAVIYPWVDTAKYNLPPAKPANFFLLAGRLVPYKRYDIVIEAFNELKLPLYIIGDGYDKQRLLRLNRNSKTIFLGRVSDKKLIDSYRRCRAYIFPALEDFGITPVEAMAAGRPVIAYGDGGATETVVAGKTGIFFPRQDKRSVVQALKKFERLKFDSRVIQKRAQKFSKARFKEEIKRFILARL